MELGRELADEERWAARAAALCASPLRPPPDGQQLAPRMVEPASFLDDHDVAQWYMGLVVEFKPQNRIYRHVIHCDTDGFELPIGLPDDTVRLLTATATHCKCRRCLLTHPDGMSLAGA